jgi:SAM-dependent methyltransferase
MKKIKKITAANDAFGLGLLEFTLNKKRNEMIERDDGVMFYVDNAEYFTPYRKWAYYDRQAISHARGRILDIGCGAGRHGIYLQEKGHDVTGIDNSPIAVKISRERGLKDARKMAIEEISPRLGKFSTVIMLGHNFGLFQDVKKMKKILVVLDKMTPEDGVIIAESMDPHRLFGNEESEYRRRNVENGMLPGHVRVRILIKNIIGPWFDYLFVSKKEMKELLEGTPWRVKRFYGGFWPTYTAIIEKRPKQ